MWTAENRHRYDRDKLRYPSDLTDAEWQLIKPLIPPAKRGGGKRTVNMREVVNGVMYVLSTGCQWRYIPKDLPPRSTVNGYLDLPRFRGELRAWDQSSCWGVILSSSFVAFFGSAPGGAILPSRPAYSAAVARSGGQGRPILGPPGGRVLDGREHDGRLVCVGSDLQTLIPALIVDR